MLWDGKRYHSLNYHLRKKFGQKVFKLPVDAGFTCPNRDGTLSRGGCLFCSPRGSGDFAGTRNQPIYRQLAELKKIMHKKWPEGKYIAYFQAFTNTYAPVGKLRELYETAINEPGVVGIAIATRPDCLPPEVLELLEEINERTYLWVEIGLQTVHSQTAKRLNLQYDFNSFLNALDNLQSRHIETCTHIILGLPGENRDDMLETALKVAALPIQGIKIHLLHLMKNTPLEAYYKNKPFPLLTREEYIGLVVDILEILPPEMVVHRLTGDSPRDLLIGPAWSLIKWEVLNGIDRSLIERDTWQGKKHQSNQ
ncbi:MAG: TIGR01212 family radical SAM protein [Syntrophomonadaceae bacterium]|jgi:radical SAM protein (TIGR01212 family)